MDDHAFSKRDTYCLKTVAIILMIVHHTAWAEGIRHFTNIGNAAFTTLATAGKLCVGLFAMLSGYGMWKNAEKKIMNAGEWTKIIQKRIIAVYKKYWLVFVLFLPFVIIRKSWRPNQLDFINNILCIDPTLNREAWYLRLFILCCSTAPILYSTFQRTRNGLWTDLLIMISWEMFARYGILEGIRNLEIFRNFSSTVAADWTREYLQYSSVFMMGMIAAKYDIFSQIKAKEFKQLSRCILGLVLIIFSIFLGNCYYDKLMGLTTIPMISGVLLLGKQEGKIKKAMAWVGKYTTYMWLTHTYFLKYAFSNYLYQLQYSILIVTACFSLSLIAAVILEYVERKIDQWIRLVFMEMKSL